MGRAMSRGQAGHLERADDRVADPAADLAQVARRVLDEELRADHADALADDVGPDREERDQGEDEREPTVRTTTSRA